MKIFLKSLVLLSLSVGIASADKEKEKPSPKPLPEMVMGSAEAPVTVIIYSSLTCNHCAHFHTFVLPKVEEKFIKPGYAQLIFRDYPGDQVSLKAHQLAWCRGKMQYLKLLGLLYSTQEKWLLAPDPEAALQSIALQHGITPKQFKSCLKDQELMDQIIQGRLEGKKKYKITATPSMIINAKIYPEALSLEKFEEVVNPLLKPILAKEKKKTG